MIATTLPAPATRAVLASDGGPVVGVESGGVIAFGPDGDARWKSRSTAGIDVTPAIDGDVVVTLANDGTLDGRDAGTGALLWRHRSPAHRSKHAPLVTADHVVLVAGSDALAAVSAADGADVATFPALAALRATPSTTTTTTADAPELVSFIDADDVARGVLAPLGAGRAAWSTALPHELSDTDSPASTATVPGGRVYAVTSTHVTALDVVGGATAVVRWSWSSDLVSNLSAPAIDAEGGARWIDGKTAMLYAATRDGVLRFSAPLVGKPTSGLAVGDPVIDARGRTYVTGGSYVFGFDADGTRLFAIDLDALATGVVIGPGRTLWITGQRLWAVQPAECRR